MNGFEPNWVYGDGTTLGREAQNQYQSEASSLWRYHACGQKSSKRDNGNTQVQTDWEFLREDDVMSFVRAWDTVYDPSGLFCTKGGDSNSRGEVGYGDCTQYNFGVESGSADIACGWVAIDEVCEGKSGVWDEVGACSGGLFQGW